MKIFLSQLMASPLGALAVLAIAALLEVSGDAWFQTGLYRASGTAKALCFVAGAAVLAAYGFLVNIPKWNFGRLLGVYVALFFLIAQVVARVRFHQSPTRPILAGGALILAGGMVIAFWKV